MTSGMASHSGKRFTQINLNPYGANPLFLNEISLVSDNPSASRNTQNLLTPEDDAAARLKRKRGYSDKEGNGCTAGSVD